ncbi:putative transporter [Prevotella sp. kh1p2]|uniref:putative transporter n=1 Tax=Prevotella sp. kh1p2 TaxID=1761883 RepID=UPI0008C70E2E|nr:putative transporter [Prevotella sp. kh1p2]SES90151.1 AspT/YidE/YbjL antiporter duplication domain-containing protein [Prevotella sp. kh1p2]SNU11602.1 AspT/YidE/YbjL antiporter duplication domain-containing protein [Prevotellaceae bacterium KH2P17]
MDWFNGLFAIQSSIQTIVVLSAICAVGLALAKLKVMGVSLGVAFVFFVGIVAGHFGLSVDHAVLDYAETFGLVLFVYMLGLHVGPNFFNSLRHEGMPLNMWSLAVILLGTAMALAMSPLTGVSLPDMVGLLCGATTNTPALGAAQQALSHLGQPSGSLALGTAVTYPLGVVGVILAMVVLRKLFVRPDDLKVCSGNDDNKTYIGEYRVENPALDGKTIAQVAQHTMDKFIISRIWRGKEVIVPFANTVLHKDDDLLVVTMRNEEAAMELLFGEKVNRNWNREKIDWNHIDSTVESREIIISRTVLNGKRLGELQLRNAYGVNVSRVFRGDIKLLATDDLRLQYGDRVVCVGEHDALHNVSRFFGNAERRLNEPNVGSIFLGVILGLALGTIPLSLPGMSAPVRLGIAGGPIVMGIMVGALGPRMHIISYTTNSASLMLRKFGLSLYLACLGLDAGKDFFATVVRPEGLMWIGLGFLLTVVPVLTVGFAILQTRKFDFGTICGILCGSMANPMALGYANDTIEGDTPSISYASVYPLGMFLRVIIAQVIIMFLV